MRCIYFNGEKCKANPTSTAGLDYSPTEQEKKDLCNSSRFQTCPRYVALITFIRASKK